MTQSRKKRLLLSLFRGFADRLVACKFSLKLEPSDIKDVILVPKKYIETDGFARIVFNEKSKNVAHILERTLFHVKERTSLYADIASFARWQGRRYYRDKFDPIRFAVICSSAVTSYNLSFLEYVKHLFMYFTKYSTKVESLEDIELQLVLMGKLEPS